jgi:hypothetical protein
VSTAWTMIAAANRAQMWLLRTRAYARLGLAAATVTTSLPQMDQGAINPGDLGLSLYVGGRLGEMAIGGLGRVGSALFGTGVRAGAEVAGATVEEVITAGGSPVSTTLRGGLGPVLKGQAGETAVRAIESVSRFFLRIR